ncbi:hypothetical protein AGMMS49957_04760 [Synergistales bacterium]|nr:hypothetical protein AGMMS49957_04760 [Synergistales bacterium]
MKLVIGGLAQYIVKDGELVYFAAYLRPLLKTPRDAREFFQYILVPLASPKIRTPRDGLKLSRARFQRGQVKGCPASLV